MIYVTNNDNLLAAAARACAGTFSFQLSEEVSYAVEDAGLRCCGPILDRRRRWRRIVNRDSLRRCRVYMSPEFDRRAEPHFAHKQYCFGSRVGSRVRRRFGRIGVKTERGHENCIDRLFL
jgi:hypothetical protein